MRAKSDQTILLFTVETLRLASFVSKMFLRQKSPLVEVRCSFYAVRWVTDSFFRKCFTQAVIRSSREKLENFSGRRRSLTLVLELVSSVANVNLLFLCSRSSSPIVGFFGNFSGHVDSSFFKISGPSIHTLLWDNCVADKPLVGKSAGLISPGMWRYWSGFVLR